jgi:biotin synthase
LDYQALAQQILAGTRTITREEALSILNSNEEWWQIYAAALFLKNKQTHNKIRLNYLLNAKSGLCNEDCGYCAQSKASTAPIKKYAMISKAEILRQAQLAHEHQASTFCIAMSGTKPNQQELVDLGEAIQTIKHDYHLEVCVSIGLLDAAQIQYLKQIGIDRVNHNLNTARDHYQKITTTHTYADRVATLDTLNAENVHICSGFICGMGETNAQLIDLAFELKTKQPYSIPINFLLPIKGTKLAEMAELTPLRCLKILAMMRFVFPASELRISAGREAQLRELQNMGILLVDSIFLGNYLTEKGDPIEKDRQMLTALGIVIEK